MTFNGLVVADQNQDLFDAAGTGLVRLKRNPDIYIPWFGADPVGSVVSTNAIQQALNAADTAAAAGNGVTDLTHGATTHFPAGQYKIDCLVTWGTSNYTNIEGAGALATNIQFVPGAGCSADADRYYAGIRLKASGSKYAYKHNIRGIAFGSTDTTHNKVALDFVDVGSIIVDDIFVYGATPAAYFTGGAGGSIGIRTNGRDNSSISNYVLVADRPLYINANPNTAASTNEDLDHWTFTNGLYYCQGTYPAITEVDGRGMSHAKWTGNQAIVGCPEAIHIKDTRTSGIPSRNIEFENFRGEEGTDVTRFWLDTSFTSALPVQTITVRNSLFDPGSQGWYLNNFNQALIENTTFAMAFGKHALSATPAGVYSSLSTRGAVWSAGALVSLASMVATNVEAYDAQDQPAPASATYAYSHPSLPEYRNANFSCPSSGGAGGTEKQIICNWHFSLAAGASQTLLNTTSSSVTVIGIDLTAANGAVVERGEIDGSATALSCAECTTNVAASNTAGKLSIYYAGVCLTALNNTAGSLSINITARIGQ